MSLKYCCLLFENEQSILAGLGSSIDFNDTLYGVNGRIYYGLNESFCFGPEISYFPYQDLDENYEKSILLMKRTRVKKRMNSV